MIKIESIESTGLAAVTALEIASGLSTGGEMRFHRLRASPQFILLGAYYDQAPVSRLIGMIYGLVVVDEFQIDNLAVDESFRRNGVGGALLEAALAAARRLGADQAILEVRNSNIAAQRLYMKYGFTILSRRKDYYSNPVEDALMFAWRAGVKNGPGDRK